MKGTIWGFPLVLLLFIIINVLPVLYFVHLVDNHVKSLQTEVAKLVVTPTATPTPTAVPTITVAPTVSKLYKSSQPATSSAIKR